MRLIGAKEFLKTVKPGTLFIQFWLNNEDSCLKLIDDYNNGLSLEKILNHKDRYGEFAFFGDNSSSLTFLVSYDEPKIYEINGVKYNCLFWYDLNIVGDASPETTLYIVFENENEWPSKVKVEGKQEGLFLTKKDLANIRKWFLKKCGPFHDETKPGLAWWPLGTLTSEEYYKNNFVVNYVSK